MSLLLSQRTDANASPQRGAAKRSRQENTHVAGVPLLLRLPDLIEGSRKRSPNAKRKTETQAKTSEPASSAAGSAKSVDTSTADADGNRISLVSAAGQTVWRNFTWQLLVLILLPVLFLTAWFVLSSPSGEPAPAVEDDGLASPDIEIGDPVPADALVSPDNHPAEPESDAQVHDHGQGNSPPELVTEPKWTSGNDVADASAAQRDDSASEASPTQPPPRPTPPHQPSGSPPEMSGGIQPPSNPLTGSAPTYPTTDPAPAPTYPTTDPSTYSYPNTSDTRAAQPPAAAGGYSYPSTGAAPLFGENPTTATGALPR